MNCAHMLLQLFPPHSDIINKNYIIIKYILSYRQNIFLGIQK